MSVQLQLLESCNLRCKHCYDDIRPRPMPSIEEVKRRIDAVYEFGRRHGFEPDMHLSGGEPTLRKDLLEIVGHIFEEHRGDALLFTNGTRLPRELARDLHSAGLRFVQVSLEGPQPLTDEVRGEGVYDAAMETLHMLREEGFRRTVSITITSRNCDSIPAFVQELDDQDLHFHLREVFPLGRGEDLLGLSSEQRRRFFDWAVGWKGTSTVAVEDPVHCSVSPDYARRRRGCVAGRNHFCIDVDGSIQPCRPLGMKVGSVDDLEAAWHSPEMTRLRERRFDGQCGRCEIRMNCGGCRVHPWLEGNPFGEDTRCFAAEHDLIRTPFEVSAVRMAERIGRGVFRVRRLVGGTASSVSRFARAAGAVVASEEPSRGRRSKRTRDRTMQDRTMQDR